MCPGWHAIFVGLWSNWTPSLLKIKLTSDPAYVAMDREEGPNGRVDNYTTDERFFKYADLTGEDIMLAQQGGGAPTPAYITYVKLVPLSDAEVEAIEAERASGETKRLFFMNDGFSNFGNFRPTEAEDIWQWLEPYRDTDFKTLLWCPGAGGDVLNYISEYGSLIGDSTTDYPRISDRKNAESHQILAGKGIDPMKTVIDYCHSMGVSVHVSNRMESFQCSPPFEEFFTGRFYTEHPEWRCVDIDGREIARMSYAYEGVRDLMLNMFKEATDKYDADGVNPIFNRGAPFLLYEQPLLDGFEAETGLDARQLAEDDERYLRYRAGVMTDFMRTLRRELDAIGDAEGPEAGGLGPRAEQRADQPVLRAGRAHLDRGGPDRQPHLIPVARRRARRGLLREPDEGHVGQSSTRRLCRAACRRRSTGSAASITTRRARTACASGTRTGATRCAWSGAC